jgi:uncharacterized repeat protein (TIGR04052 family)
VEVPFRASVGAEPVSCAASYAGLGRSSSTISLLDLRFFIHDLALIDGDGAAVPVTLDEDVFQRDGTALVDLEDDSGTCATGSPETHAVVTGTVPAGDYVGLSFVVGVPKGRNHLDAATAPAPLDEPGMWWSWAGGYKYVRLDVATETNPAFYLHLGATGCEGSVLDGFTCLADNRPSVTLADFQPGSHAIDLDLAALYADSDLEAAPDFVSDFVSGCMAFSGDGECAPIFDRFGLSWEGSAPSPATVFAVEAL